MTWMENHGSIQLVLKEIIQTSRSWIRWCSGEIDKLFDDETMSNPSSMWILSQVKEFVTDQNGVSRTLRPHWNVKQCWSKWNPQCWKKNNRLSNTWLFLHLVKQGSPKQLPLVILDKSACTQFKSIRRSKLLNRNK